jgi:hypothetical protein
MVVVNEEVGGGPCSSYSTDCLLATDDSYVNSWDDSWVDSTAVGGGGTGGGGSKNFSCRFLAQVDQEVIKMVHMDNFEEALRTVELGQHWGVIHFMVSRLNIHLLILKGLCSKLDRSKLGMVTKQR